MFLAPALVPAGKRRGLFLRSLFGCGVTATAVVLLQFNLFLVLAHYYVVIPEVSAQQLYHRAWQMARDNIYDRSLLQAWDTWEHKYDGKINSEKEAIKYINKMIAALDDPVTMFMDARSVEDALAHADSREEGTGIVVSRQGQTGSAQSPGAGSACPDNCPAVDASLLDTPAYQAGVKPGDRITSVDGRSTAGWSMEQLAAALRGKPGSAVKLGICRDASHFTVTLVRESVPVPIVSIRHLPGGIGYLRLQAFDRWDAADQLQTGLVALADCRALIVDIRGNHGGFIHAACDSASMFFDRASLMTIEIRLPQAGYIKFRAGVEPAACVLTLENGPFAGASLRLPRRYPNLTGRKPVVLLVDRFTASASEIFAGALQDNGRVTVIGTRTFGKGIGQTDVPVGNGSRLRVTNIKVWSPNGSFRGDCGKTVSNGVVPDVVVYSMAWHDYGDDNVLQAAVKFLADKQAAGAGLQQQP